MSKGFDDSCKEKLPFNRRNLQQYHAQEGSAIYCDQLKDRMKPHCERQPEINND